MLLLFMIRMFIHHAIEIMIRVYSPSACVSATVFALLQNFQYIREFTDRPMDSRQAVLANVAKNVVDTDAGEHSAAGFKCGHIGFLWQDCHGWWVI